MKFKRLKIAGIFFLLFINSTATLKAQNSQKEEVSKIFNDYFQLSEPGATIAVVKNGAAIYKESFGMAILEHNIPIKSNTVFELGSVAKQFTGHGIAILLQQGQINLLDDIKKYIPELPNYGVKISIEDLLHHKSGLMDQYALLLYSGYRDGDVMTKEDVMNAILGENQLDYLPGEHYTYNNSNYRLLAEIIQRVSKKSFPQFMKDNIFTPLKMSNTQFSEDCEKVIKNTASSYYQFDDTTYNKFSFSTCTVGSSGLWSTIEDMTKWLHYLGRLDATDSPLLKWIQKGSQLNDGTPVNYGFGFEIDSYENQKLIYHNGVMAGFNSQVYYFPKHSLGIVILSNNDNLSYDLANQVASVYIKDILPKEVGVEKKKTTKIIAPKKPIALNKNVVKKYLGDYIFNNGDVISFKVKNGAFYRSMKGRKDIQLLPISSTKFYYENREHIEIDFSKSKNGKANEFKFYNRGRLALTAGRLMNESEKDLKKYEGSYAHNKLNIHVSIFFDKGQLMITHFKYGTSTLNFSSKKGLFTRSVFWLNRLEFIKDNQGEIISIKLLNPPNDRFNGVVLYKKTQNG